MGGGVAVIAAAVRKELALANTFRRAGALSPDTATTSASLGVEERHAWRRLVQRGIIRQAPSSGYYLDEAALDVWNRTRRKRVLSLLAIVVGLYVAWLVRTWLQ
jgi:hypothetical protein